MEETWKPVPEYEGLYEVSDFGRIRRVTGLTKLTVEDVAEAKEMRKANIPFEEIGKRFNVCAAAIFEALNRKLVMASRRIPNRIRKPYINKSGYAIVRLSKNGVIGTSTVAGLVAAAFIGPRPPGKVIDHKNRQRADNRPSNLRYVSQSKNLRNRAIRCPWCGRSLRFNGKRVH